MNPSVLDFLPHLAAALAAGAVGGWVIGGLRGKYAQKKAHDKWLVKFDEAVRQRDRFNAENTKLRTQIEAQQAVVHKHEMAVTKLRTELESAAERIKAMAKQQFALGTERDELRSQLNRNVNALDLVKRQAADLETEFVKTGVFYKGELEKSFEKRKLLQSKVEGAQAEQDSLGNLLEAARSENVSLNRMLAAAQARVDTLDALEQKVIRLEAENAELRHESARTQQSADALQRDLSELEELKVQNRELAHCLKSMEDSRQQYERDAQRYRDRANQSEKQSETLRLKLDDVEKSFSDMARKQDEALKLVRNQESRRAEPAGNASSEVDDLTEIVGIGKVFQETLHRLGVTSFRQIAAFGPSDIARVNQELKEFRGRMEQDDWIGQAKELMYRKYGETH